MTTETTLYRFSIEIYFHSDMHTDVTHMRTSELERIVTWPCDGRQTHVVGVVSFGGCNHLGRHNF
jgi:hypothetical protein